MQLNQQQQANRKAWGDLLAHSEGTSTSPATRNNGYDVIVTGKDGKPEIFTDYSDHPFANRPGKIFNNQGQRSTASGRYQQLYRWWPAYKKQLGLTDFSPKSQELLLDQLLKEQGAYLDVLNGHIKTVMEKCNDIWASLPGSPYGQHTNDANMLIAVYQKSGGKLA
ncbi:glycoside hydrolase family 24 protein [Rosenbergiella collisarenosi]|uniref:glycoside hydrolase family 24 protein n=1 Tax=Rosenbergiella collisarenosi TaxID=1544695 RepID=UPI001F4DA0DD|nr:glycoside hydrolase family 104 protein [Rosenbergiella collisarenosi]